VCDAGIMCDGGSPDAAEAGLCGVVACEQCAPTVVDGGDAAVFIPVTQGKPTALPNACAQAELQAFVTACFSSVATTATCTVWNLSEADAGTDGGEGACAVCLAAVPQSSPTWGPFDCVATGLPCSANSGGCVDLVLGTVSKEVEQGGAGSCGDAITSAYACEDYACSTCKGADIQTCLQDSIATTHECSAFAAAQTSPTGPCATVNDDAAPSTLATCFPQTDAANLAFVNVFCGTGP